MKLDNKVVLVTGASRGIGRATAVVCAREGARVAVNYKANERMAQETVERIGKDRAHAIQADVSREQDVRNLVAQTVLRFGKIDVLVNNAGMILRPADWKGDVVTWHKTIDTNLMSAWLMTREVAPYMQKRGKGAIVNVGSIFGILGAAGALAYTAAKGGLVTMTRAFAKELAPAVRVNAVLPSNVATDMAREAGDVLLEEFRKLTPLARIASSEEIAEVIAFLASDEASYVTGAVVPVDGGYSLR